MKFKIEPLQAADWLEFYSCFQEILTSDFGQYLPEKKEIILKKIYSEKKLKDNFQAGKKQILVAKLDRKVGGFLIYVLGVGGISYINWLGVRKELRRKGIGRKLIEAWEKEALKEGVHKLSISTTDKKNKNFYQKLNFRLEGERRKHRWGLDYLLFGKLIK